MARKKIEKDIEVVDGVDMKEIYKKIDDRLDIKEDEILKNINTKINEQIEFSVNKRMREEEKKFVRGKNAKIFRRDILIIILIMVAGYFGYCLYDVDYFNLRGVKIIEKVTDNNQNTNNNDTEKEKEEKSKYYIDNYGYLIDKLNIEDKEVFDLYKNNISKNNVSNSLKLKIAYKNLNTNDVKTESGIINIDKDKMSDSYKNVFGNNDLDNGVFSYNNIKFMFYNDKYLGFDEDKYDVNLLTKITFAYIEKDELVFEVLVAKKEDNKLLDIEGKIVEDNYHDEDIGKFESKLTKYKYIFSKDNNNYYFDRIEK